MTEQSIEPVQPQESKVVAPQVEADEKFFAAIGYFSFLFVIPLIVKPKSEFCKFHVKQSMVLFLVSIVVLMFLAAIPMIGSLLTLAFFALNVLVIYRAYIGDMWNIPVVCDFAKKINFDTIFGKAGLAVSGISGMKEKAEDFAKKAGEAAKNMGNQDEVAGKK